MRTLKTYNNSEEYLKESITTLESKELENNLIIGICKSLKNTTNEDYHFINIFQKKNVIATSIKTSAKVIIFCTTNDKEAINEIANYYLENKINIKGVIGESNSAEIFTECYGAQILRIKPLCLQRLIKTNDINISEGYFQVCTVADSMLLNKWTTNFFIEEELLPKKSQAEVEAIVETILESKDFYCWKMNNKIVSIASILRKTKNYGIVGIAYTPKEFRGNGYASSCVKILSDYILVNGFQFCGLFTDKANPTSNKIYGQIGYETVTEFKNIEFSN
jgi:predicted GNAT family acetyltransferase